MDFFSTIQDLMEKDEPMENIPVNTCGNFSLFQLSFTHAVYLNSIPVHSFLLKLWSRH